LIRVLKEIFAGGLSKEELMSRFLEADIQFNEYAKVLFEDPAFFPSEHSSSAKLIKVSLPNLNMKRGFESSSRVSI